VLSPLASSPGVPPRRAEEEVAGEPETAAAAAEARVLRLERWEEWEGCGS
jgi:hypothetical protein